MPHLWAMYGIDGGGWAAAGEPVLGASAGPPQLWELYIIYNLWIFRDGPRWAHLQQVQVNLTIYQLLVYTPVYILNPHYL